MLISINPLSQTVLYSDQLACFYHTSRALVDDESYTPHIYAMARQLRFKLACVQRSQTCFFMGYSYSGKSYNVDELFIQLIRPYPIVKYGLFFAFVCSSALLLFNACLDFRNPERDFLLFQGTFFLSLYVCGHGHCCNHCCGCGCNHVRDRDCCHGFLADCRCVQRTSLACHFMRGLCMHLQSFGTSSPLVAITTQSQRVPLLPWCWTFCKVRW